MSTFRQKIESHFELAESKDKHSIFLAGARVALNIAARAWLPLEVGAKGTNPYENVRDELMRMADDLVDAPQVADRTEVKDAR